MHKHSIAELSKKLHNKEISSVELTKIFLDRIKQLSPKLNSFITVTEDQALSDAKYADQLFNDGKAKPLTGIPIVYKDNFCTKDIKTSAGSKMLDNFISPYDATVVKKFKASGTVLLGKTNMDEFAMGSSNENSYYGPVRNPWNLDAVPGGSSGGSAACVAARLSPAATGTDTGGSVRQPASLCGVTGIKPTYGRISRFGIIALGSSLDQVGVFTQSAEDAAMLLNSSMGFDPKDSTSIEKETKDLTASLNNPLNGIKIGLLKECFSDQLNPKIADTIYSAAKQLEDLGASIQEISLPKTHLAIPVYYIVGPAECASNLARYDGVRFGYSCKDPKNLLDLYERTRAEGFGDEVKHRIMIGTYLLSAGYYDSFYLKAQKIRRLISNDYQNAFKQVDVILSPTSPSTAFKIGSKNTNRIEMYLQDMFTISTNLAGLPGVSAPAGFIDGLPVGLQLTGNYFDEEHLLNVLHKFQQVTDWHRQIPSEFE